MHRPLILTALALLAALPGVAVAQNAPSPQWQAITRSHDVNYEIHCYRGKEEVYGVHTRPGTSDWQVARDIWFYPLPNGRTALSFMHGFVSATKQATYVAASDVGCEMNEA
jgi:hypothetical protein